MKKAFLALASAALLGVASQAFPLLGGGEIPFDRILQGKWCFAFVVAPGCGACDMAIDWLEDWDSRQTQSEIQVALVVPWETPELREALGEVPLPVIIDSQFVLASWFHIEVAPTVVLFAEGTFSEKLKWPFDRDDLETKLEELKEFVIPRPQDLLGGPPPELRGVNLQGKEVGIEDLPRPVLLFFFSTTCPACRASLAFLDDFTKLLPVAMVVLNKGHELSDEDRNELSDLKEKYGDKLTVVVLGKREKETMERYRIRWTPTFFLVGKDGLVKAVWEGPTETLVLEIEEYLETGDPEGGSG